MTSRSSSPAYPSADFDCPAEFYGAADFYSAADVSGAAESHGAGEFYSEPLRSRPPRQGLRRPGTALGNPQVPF